LLNLNIQSIAFLDALNGIVVANDRAYRTFNGGASWTKLQSIVPTSASASATYFFAVTRKDSNTFLLFENDGNSTFNNLVLSSEASSNQYELEHSFSSYGVEFNNGHLSNNKFYVFPRNNAEGPYVRVLHLPNYSWSLLNNEAFTYAPNDAVFVDGKHILACKTGKIYPYGSAGYSSERYNYHDEDYQSIESMGTYQIAVAEKGISTNYNGKWEEAVEIDGTGHSENFFFIRQFDSDHFLISGSKGTFLKATFK